ncbi:Signal transduction histidine kinase [Dyadobacter koreensis]|uniref:histidine kinase n=1 Tax=Dyadobacter koreensis TaxID=408657 RepID=A0A1H6QTJ1_9BACT|nr:hybrid sensor histidine kinase/response regulator [Dyadobacter koreensis]SEI44254.1 Signal transduction histidine kinase [Dyadobacter koreensis]
MFPLSSVMANKRFSYLIFAAFIIGTIFLIVVQYNSARNIDSLLRGNDQLLRELMISNHLRTIDRDLLGVESRIRAGIATDDTSHLEGVDAKIVEVKSYLDTIKASTEDEKTRQLLDRLNVLATEKIEIKHKLMNRFLNTGEMKDTSLIANPRARRISNEITSATYKIYDSRQKMMSDLSNTIGESGRKARLYGNLLVALLLVSSGGLCWFIVKQFHQQNQLILKLDDSEKTAREALQVKENFLANMSHEIRTPLNSILGFTNLLKRKKLEQDSSEFVGSIQSAGENLLSIINDILDLSKIEAGMMRIVVNPFSVRGLIHSLETLFSEKVKEKGLTLKSRIDPEIPDTLIGDATRLTQILVNLIGNALKFSEEGEILVSICSKKISGDVIHLGFSVADRGIGINKEKIAAIFERFNQAEDSITRNYGGTGLGLSIVKNLVTLQNGEIEVKSEPGKGTSFNFYIPYLIAEEQITDLSIFDAETTKAAIHAPMNILVVDDNLMNQSLMKHLLSQWNASFEVVSGGAEAISTLKEKKFDLVLMDIQMPGMDGYTTTRNIREDLGLQLPIIAMTAHAMAGEREKSLSHGMNEYISKPINEHDLFTLISKFVKRDQAVQTAHETSPKLVNYQYINLTYMKEISKGNVGYEKIVTEQFIQCMPEDVSGLQSAFEKKDFTKLNQIAHNMKTSVAIMGLLPKLETLLDKLEYAAAETSDVQKTITEVTIICIKGVREAEHFQEILSA